MEQREKGKTMKDHVADDGKMVCQFCGADERERSKTGGWIEFECKSTLFEIGKSQYRTRACELKEVENLKAKIAALEAHVSRLVDAGDSIAEESHPTIFCGDSTTKRKVSAMDVWNKVKEAKL